jgi:hypothetical protein
MGIFVVYSQPVCCRKRLIVCLVALLAVIGSATEGAENACVPGISKNTVSDRTVSVTVERAGGLDPLTGFGLLVFSHNREASFITVAHVLGEGGLAAPGSTIKLRFNDSSFYKGTMTASVKAIDPKGDLALLQAKLPDTDYHQDDWALELPSSPTIYRGQQVWFVGRFGEWYIPVDPGVVNLISPNLRVQIDRIDIQPGSSGGPVFTSDGLVGLVADKITAQSAIAINMVSVLGFLTTNGVNLPLDSPIMRAVRYWKGRNFAKTFVDNEQKRAEARVAQKKVEGDLAGEHSLGPVMLANGGVDDSAETLLFTWHSAGDGGGNHSETYLTAVPMGGQGTGFGTPTTSQTGESHVNSFAVDQGTTVCTSRVRRIALKGCLSDGTTADCSKAARMAFLNCANRFVELGAMRIEGSAFDLADELENKPLDDAIAGQIGARISQWSIPLTQLDKLSPSLRANLLQYKPYPAATEISGLKVEAIESKDAAKAFGLQVGTILLGIDSGKGISTEALACRMEPWDEQGVPDTKFHLWNPGADAVVVTQVPITPDPLDGTQFTLAWVDSRSTLAESVKQLLIKRGAVFLHGQRWQMLKMCHLTIANGDNSLARVVERAAQSLGIAPMEVLVDSTYGRGRFELMIGDKCPIP